MKVYSVLVEQVQDFNTIRLSVNNFSSFEKAKKFFDSFVDDEITYFKVSNGDIINRDENSFEAYPDCDYANIHSIANIIETELDDETVNV